MKPFRRAVGRLGGAAILLSTACSSGGASFDEDMVPAVDAQRGELDLGPVDLRPVDLQPVDSCGCHAGQQCVQGRCEFTCTGLRVPGDFATLAEATKQVAKLGGTICLGEGTHMVPEQLSIPAEKSMKIIGVSALRTTVQMASPDDDFYFPISTPPAGPAVDVLLAGFRLTGGVLAHLPANGATYTFDSLHVEKGALFFQEPDGFSTLRIGQSRFDDGVSLHGCHAEIVASQLRSESDIALFLEHAFGTMDVLVDGCELQSTKSDAISIYEHSATPTAAIGASRIALQNSYLANSDQGLTSIDSLQPTDVRTRTIEVSLVNNTFANNKAQGIFAAFQSKYVTWNITYANNVLYGSNIGVTLAQAPAKLLHRNNALFGNMTNYSGVAVAGAGDISQDPLLDKLQSPWAPLPTSPLRGAADTAIAPSRDFFGRPRTPKPDIGCVQYSATPPAPR